MRVSAITAVPLLLTSSFAHALPVAEHSVNPLKIWVGAVHDVWDVIRGSALGWFNFDVYDEPEGAYLANDKTVYEWLSDNPKCVSIYLGVCVGT